MAELTDNQKDALIKSYEEQIHAAIAILLNNSHIVTELMNQYMAHISLDYRSMEELIRFYTVVETSQYAVGIDDDAYLHGIHHVYIVNGLTTYSPVRDALST